MADTLKQPQTIEETPTGLSQAMAVAAMFAGALDLDWQVDDDRCDCTYQRIGWWANPYLGVTQEMRLCCAWAWLLERFPEMQAFVRVTDAWRDPETQTLHTKPIAWNSTDRPMPRALWYRQLARLEGKTLAEVRVEYAEQTPPAALPKRA